MGSQHHQSDSQSDREPFNHRASPSSTPSMNGGESARNALRTENSGLSIVSQVQSAGGDRPIVAVAHRYQRSWKSRLAASMRQARDFLSRPRVISRTYSTRRHNTVGAREELLRTETKIDINAANKQELLLLPGVDNSLANAILDHRKLLVGGRFKRIDDLINVPGLNVEKLNKFREFIVIPKFKPSASGDSIDGRPNRALLGGQLGNGSPTLSESGPMVSQNPAICTTLSPNCSAQRLSTDNGTPLAPTNVLNINKASEADFVLIGGIPEDVAKKIVMARQNAGPFQSVADLRRVKGVSKSLFVRVSDRLTIEDSQQKSKLAPPIVTLSSSQSSGNFRQSETDSGVTTAISLVAGGSSGGSNTDGPPSNGGAPSVTSGNTSKQVSPDSVTREMDINNLPDVIIKYTKPSDLELIHKLQINNQSGSRGAISSRGRNGLQPRGHSRNVSDFGVIATDYTDILTPIYPSDMHGIRPFVEPFDFRAPNGHPVVRYAFWDVEDCGMDKISNPGVLETICMTILENGISIVAFTDLLDVGVVDRIADQLTWPSLHCVREWRGVRGSWRSAVVKTGYRNASSYCDTEPRSRTSSAGSLNGDGEKHPIYCGFIYDTSRSIELVSRCHFSSPLQQKSIHTSEESLSVPKSPPLECLNVALPKTALHRLAYKPAAAKFSLSTTTSGSDQSVEPSYLAIVCLKLSSDDSAFFKRRDIALSTAPLLTAVLEAVNSFGDVSANKQTNMPIILSGSFGVDANERCFDLLRVAGYQLVSSEKTNISRKLPSGSVCSDHVWVADLLASSATHRQFTGRAGVVRKALTHPQIPDGWAWGGLVSSHCPVWAEFYVVPQPFLQRNPSSSNEIENTNCEQE